MESIRCELSPENFDKAVHGGLDDLPTLADFRDLAVFVKPKVTVAGKAGAVLTFTVQLPDGSKARAQTVTTVALLDMMLSAVRGWQSGGRL